MNGFNQFLMQISITIPILKQYNPVSIDIKRVFSKPKHILSERRHNFTGKKIRNIYEDKC